MDDAPRDAREAAPSSKVRVHVDEHGVVRVEVDSEDAPDLDDLVTTKASDPVAPFRDEEFKARQHIRWFDG